MQCSVQADACSYACPILGSGAVFPDHFSFLRCGVGYFQMSAEGGLCYYNFFADIELAVSREIDRVKWTIRFNFLFPILFHGC